MNRISITALMAALLLPMTASAGLDDPGTVGSNMPTTTQIYDLLNAGTAIPAPASGTFLEPAAGPAAGARRTLAEIQGKLPVPAAGGAAAGDVLAGKSFWGLLSGAWGLKSGTMPNNGAVSITPGTAPRTIAAGYHNGSGTVAGDASLVSGNIKSGTTIFGVAGNSAVVDTSAGTATAGEILFGKTAYINGQLITGTLVARRVNKTGQTQCFDRNNLISSCAGTGQDGQFQYGINPVLAPTGGAIGAYNTPVSTGNRFIDNGNGTVTDNMTTLVWLKDGSCLGAAAVWTNALTTANTLSAASAPTACGLSDGSQAGQWRLPNINELHSLGPTWPPGAPLTGASLVYWSSTTVTDPSVVELVGYTYVWLTSFGNGDVIFIQKWSSNYYYNVWPVRGGQQ